MKRWEIIYLSIGLLCILAISLKPTYPLAFVVFKPLIMATLIITYLQKVNKVYFKAFFYALIFSWIGDILLLNGDNLTYFMLGLTAFLVSHIFYILAYLKSAVISLLDITQSSLFIATVIYAIGFLVFLWPTLSDFKIPVSLYVMAISLMVLTALFRERGVSKRGRNLVITGALLFVVSDSILAYDTFKEVLKSAEYTIMISYICAQYLIFKGYISDFATISTAKAHSVE